MPSKERRLAIVGSLLRDDLLLHMLIQVIGPKTVDDWVFHNRFEADLILCNLDSSLSGVAPRRVLFRMPKTRIPASIGSDTLCRT
jgi:hypothetical protein